MTTATKLSTTPTQPQLLQEIVDLNNKIQPALQISMKMAKSASQFVVKMQSLMPTEVDIQTGSAMAMLMKAKAATITVDDLKSTLSRKTREYLENQGNPQILAQALYATADQQAQFISQLRVVEPMQL